MESQLSQRKGLTKKATDKFSAHESSSTHKEAVLKCAAVASPSIHCLMNAEQHTQQQVCHAGLLKQLCAMRYLLRQGLSLRGHNDTDGNLYQLLHTWAEDNEALHSWLQRGRFLSHDPVNEMITLMGHDVLRKVIACITSIVAQLGLPELQTRRQM